LGAKISQLKNACSGHDNELRDDVLNRG